ncbi:MAG: argininosuccinate lyase [Candidatus Hermodarchaeota archaeon]
MPKDMYRGRLDRPLDEKVVSFLSSLEDDLWIVEEDIIGTEVHDIMLYEQGILNENEIREILTALEDVRQRFLSGKLELDSSFEDIHPFVEKSVIDAIGMEIGGKIHTGRSRNDQVSVDIRLKMRAELNKLTDKLLDLIDTLLALSQKTTKVFVPLYTHFQAGQLGVFAHYVHNYVAQILRSLERIEEVYNRVNFNPLGACAIGGTSVNINRERTTELLGFNGIVINSIDAVSSRDYVYETLSCLSLISIQFSRIAEDLLVWSTKEFQFVELDDRYCSVSSVMPQKKNADTLELIRSKSSKIVSELFSASITIKAIPTGYFKDFQELKPLVRDSFASLFSITEILDGIFRTLKINEKEMIKNVDNSYLLALDLAEYLVANYEIPFRVSHEIVGTLVKESSSPQDLFNKEKIERLIEKIYEKKISLSKDFPNSIKNLDLCLQNRVSLGSPSFSQINNTTKTLEQKREILTKKFRKRVEHIDKINRDRENLIKKLLT